jgi:Zn-dependent protease
MTRLGGGFRIGRLFGVDVYLHWSWVVVAAIEIQTRSKAYESQAFNVIEYLALFAIVLAHELGHALACRSVGGRAERILLWPLGGVAFVQPPPRPDALLWSIAAGPLVNLVLLVLTTPLLLLLGRLSLSHDAHHFVVAFWAINLVLFCFNMLPVYPLDGGQILQALLWFAVGRARSLLVVSIIGMIGAAGFLVAAVSRASIWLSLIAVYAGARALSGLKQARTLAAMAAAPRRTGVACPSCGAAPPVGDFWLCPCRKRFDTFATHGVCPHCGRTFGVMACGECQRPSPYEAYYSPTTPPMPPAVASTEPA